MSLLFRSISQSLRTPISFDSSWKSPRPSRLALRPPQTFKRAVLKPRLYIAGKRVPEATLQWRILLKKARLNCAATVL
jgi:hypothetical protein